MLGHFKVEGNEVANRLAREPLSKENTDLNVMMGKSEWVSICNEKLELQWPNEWNQEQRGRHYWEKSDSFGRAVLKFLHSAGLYEKI